MLQEDRHPQAQIRHHAGGLPHATAIISFDFFHLGKVYFDCWLSPISPDLKRTLVLLSGSELTFPVLALVSLRFSLVVSEL
jgi:hypothetical protein